MTPMLSYEDGLGALRWLNLVFGFEIAEEILDENGKLIHGELRLGDQIVYVANAPSGYQSPNTLAKLYPPAAEWQKSPCIINGVLVQVEEIESLFESVLRSDAKILSDLEYGNLGTRFRVADLEGNRWMFIQRD